MAENFINPIMMSFGLLDGYRELLVENLGKAGLSEQDIAQVCNSMEVDRGLFLSINRKYLSGKSSFRSFVHTDNRPGIFVIDNSSHIP